MYDINFYRKTYNLFKRIKNGETYYDIYSLLENYRSKDPIIYNIETTNACNMECKMCPRTTMMTRDIKTISMDNFYDIVDQLKPFTEKEWNEWVSFVKTTYNINPDDMSENHFFLYIIPQVIQLHGYGDPLLDVNMHKYIEKLKEKGLKSYFSCNPANINIERTQLMFESGLDYIKYSIESVDDKKHKEIRGDASNFNESFNKIKTLLELKEKHKYDTTIIITMLDLNNSNQKEEYKILKDKFKDLNVYIYLKSEDQQWYREDYHGTNSIHWSEVCKHPWMSMTIKSDGMVAMCMEDFNNEILLGDTKYSTLYDIWNSHIYNLFRKSHIYNNCNIKCSKQCDMKMIGECYEYY